MSSTTFITRLASAGSTVGTRLIVRDTVAVDTFALLAISRMSMDYDLAEFLSHRIQIPSLNQCKHKRPDGPIKIQIAPARKMMRSCDAVILTTSLAAAKQPASADRISASALHWPM